MIRFFLMILICLMVGCGVPPEDWYDTRPGSDEEWMARMDASMEKWIAASQYLPRERLEGMQSAGFFEIADVIYSHHCDKHGNMIRYKFDEENRTWKNIKYETLGCIDGN